MVSEVRTRETRDRAEEALVRFALLAGDHAQDFVVIGGLNPDFLAPDAPVLHTGTTDVDLLFELGFVYDREDLDFAWLDAALARGGFQDRCDTGWQWRAMLGSARVRLDLLCDVPDSEGQAIALPGAVRAATQNLAGPGAALPAPVTRRLAVAEPVRRDHPGAPVEVALRFANRGGYLLAKGAAAATRAQAKDFYDLLYVTLYSPGGAGAAAKAVTEQLARLDQPQLARRAIVQAMRELGDAGSEPVSAFVTGMRDAGDDAPDAEIRTDAVVGARRFLHALGVP